MLDIDHFKDVNDTYGHPAGDSVLSEIAALLKGVVRMIEVAARYGLPRRTVYKLWLEGEA